ncbi:hypothetical protein EPK99_17395 [Neorhizobium lilium]|uniref:Uncharacterized protein n=1 Tax=Neorhizobium lilium TaxID=2503024 RepID=A0A3S3RGU0_9HYPH|nr:hypothetical protein [Neorhizobium lilium]RWX75478.1 hypothetical protein EPK99_17395 [Neorhizobium lilium]
MPTLRRFSPFIALAITGLGLWSCQSKPVVKPSSASALDVMEKVAVSANRCWFKSGDPAFKSYSFAPELTSFSDRPRILLTRKGSADIRPLLVVQAEGRPARLSAFGPMMNDPIGGRISKDVQRWSAGQANC